ncbi:MAG: AAA family ATPase [Aeromicrobium sp.]|uniref:AAA family ATPase n=1 Tax=Aeromicrobium sp. TaxID=1871063 RepID=UPI0039E62D83
MTTSDQPTATTGQVDHYPHWLRDIDAHLPVAAHYFLHGNIRDRHLVPTGERFAFPTTADAIARLLSLSGYETLLTYDPVAGLGLTPDDEASRSALSALPDGSTWTQRIGRPLTPEALAQLIAAVQPDGRLPRRLALVIDYASQFAPTGQPLSDEFHAMFRTALHRMHHTGKLFVPGAGRAALYNPVFWILDRQSDLPGWLVSATDGSHSVPIPTPDLDTRTTTARQLARDMADGPLGAFADEHVDAFASLTDGMTLHAMHEILQLALDRGLTADRVADAVRMYRVGLLENPWEQETLKTKIATAEETLSDKVRGQHGAIRRSLDILMRSTTGLTAAHTGGASTGPRGVLFLAGPTGVGKTELAKALTRVIFGSPDAYIRFDMSEFAHEGSDQRLMGSPPGYIGHDAGGELTNAIRQKPFSLVLFDEIEKAHPKIMDKFLQVLSDGRLTDGSGATVHFSESIIVFTSNQGMADPLPDGTLPSADLTFEQLDAHVRRAVTRHFTETLKRPEILNRIGDNVVVFDYIREDVAEELLRIFVTNAVERVRELHGVTVTLGDAAWSTLRHACCSDLSMGGRGIGQNVESVFTNPLARTIFFLPPSARSIDIVGIDQERDGTWSLRLS